MNTRKGLGIFLGVVCALTVILGFTSCGDDDGGGNLVGTWAGGSGDSFTVTDTTFNYAMSDGMDYAGTIESGSDSLTSTSGYLVLHLTSSGGANAFTAGKYICIHWKGLSENSVQQAGPYKIEGDNTGADSASAARAKFTVEDGYFGYYSNCTRQ